MSSIHRSVFDVVPQDVLQEIGVAEQEDPKIRLTFVRGASGELGFSCSPTGTEQTQSIYERLRLDKAVHLLPEKTRLELSVSARGVALLTVDGRRRALSRSPIAEHVILNHFATGYNLHQRAQLLAYERGRLASAPASQFIDSMEGLLKKYIASSRAAGKSPRHSADVNLWVACPHCGMGQGDSELPRVSVAMPTLCEEYEFFPTWLQVVYAAHVAVINERFSEVLAMESGGRLQSNLFRRRSFSPPGNTDFD